MNKDYDGWYLKFIKEDGWSICWMTDKVHDGWRRKLIVDKNHDGWWMMDKVDDGWWIIIMMVDR